MSALAKEIEQQADRLDERHIRMVREIHAHVMSSPQEYGRWDAWIARLLAASHAGEPVEDLIEKGYRHLLFVRQHGDDHPPQTREEWAGVLVFNSADEIRQRAAKDRR